MAFKIAVLPGDGIGPEVAKEAVRLLETIGEVFDHDFTFEIADIGGVAVDKTGNPLPQTTASLAQASDGVLLGAVGGPKWDKEPGHRRPETGLLGLRKALDVFANLRPITVYKELIDASPLKREVVEGVDMLIVRELTGGLYFGQPKGRFPIGAAVGALGAGVAGASSAGAAGLFAGPAGSAGSGAGVAGADAGLSAGPSAAQHEGTEVVDTLRYTDREIRRILQLAFDIASRRNGRVTSVDKANVLESSRLWRELAEETASGFPDVQLSHMLVDNAAMQLVLNPGKFDVLVTENMFGDILSDEGAVISGSIGLLPSASLSENGPGLYEPIHGSAPDIAGKGLANPIGMMLSTAMLLDHGLGLYREADTVRQAVQHVIASGARTADIASAGVTPVGTETMGNLVREAVKQFAEREAGQHV